MNQPATTRTGLAAAFGLACLLMPLRPAWSDTPLPEALNEKVQALEAPLQAFIESGEVLKFIPERQLRHELATRDIEALRRLMEDLVSLADKMAYDPEHDMGAAPLNTESERFNQSTVTTPEPLRDLQRDPGPFSVHRYLVPASGVPTFAGARVAIWPEDLVAGDVDVAIVGVPTNMSSGRRDARHGPQAMRALDTLARPDVQSLIKPLEALSIVDYGDFAVDNLSIERTIDHVTAMVAETARTGAIPMLVGGDTSMLYPGVKGIAEARGRASFGLLHFSAHPDIDRFDAHIISDRQAIFRLLDQEIIRGQDTVLVGLRGKDVGEASLGWLREKKVRYHTMAEVLGSGADEMFRRLTGEVQNGPESFFVSIDVSALEPAGMIAAGRMEPNGLALRDVWQAIRHVCATKDIVGFEITDLAPMLDHSRLSVANANALLNACLVGISLRKSGLKPDYVHPFALDHGQR